MSKLQFGLPNPPLQLSALMTINKFGLQTPLCKFRPCHPKGDSALNTPPEMVQNFFGLGVFDLLIHPGNNMLTIVK